MSKIVVFPKVQSLDTHTPQMRLRALLVAQTIFEIGLEDGTYQEKDRRAIVFALWHKAYDEPLLVRHIGDTFPDEVFRNNCFTLAPEKIDRTFRLGHLSSYYSRNPDVNEWGGAIAISVTRESVWGISGSGQREKEDEGFSIVAAMYAFGIPAFTEEINHILIQSDNFKFTHEFLDLVADRIGPPQPALAA